MSKDQVSRLCRVTAFLDRPLEGAYPYLWLDASTIGAWKSAMLAEQLS